MLTKKIELIKSLHSHSSIMKKGIYMMNGRFIHRYGAKLPKHLINSRSSNIKKIPVYSILSNKEGYDVILDASGDGYLFLDTVEKKILRMHNDAVYTDEYRDLRNEYSKVIRNPEYVIANNKQWQIEEMLGGQIAENLSEHHQYKTIKHLEFRLIELTSESKHGYAKGYFERYMKTIGPEFREIVFKSGLDMQMLAKVVDSSVLTPSHGDLVLHNVICNKRDTFVIDWDPGSLSVRPFWFDIISLYKPHYSSSIKIELLNDIKSVFTKEILEKYFNDSLSKNDNIESYLLVGWYICFLSGKKTINRKYLSRLNDVVGLTQGLHP